MNHMRFHQKIPRWMFMWGSLVLIVSMIPYIAGVFTAPTGWRFTGNLISCFDTFSYFADMQLGYQGYWLYRMPFSAATNQPVPLFMVYILLGHAARLFHLPIPLVFHIARVVFSGCFLFASAKLILSCFSRVKEQKLAFGILIFTGGIGWLASLVLGIENVSENFRPDAWWIEAVSFNSILSMPHFTLSMAIMIWMLFSGERLIKEFRWKNMVKMCVGGLLIALIHPQQIIILSVIYFFLLLKNHLPDKAALVKNTLFISVALLPGLLLSSYSTLTSLMDLNLSSWLAQGNTYSPPAWSLLLLYGPILPLSFLGAWSWWKKKDDVLLPLVIWLVLVPFLLYFPVNFQRRFIEGWHVPVAILASAGWYRILFPIFERKLKRIAQFLLAIILFSVGVSPIFVFSAVLMRLVDSNPDVTFCSYDSRDERSAMTFLQKQGDFNTIVLSEYIYGAKIPAETGLRAVIGHVTLTPFYYEREEDVRMFFNENTHENHRKSILKSLGVDIVYMTNQEKTTALFQDADYLSLIFRNDSISIYRVETEKLAED